MDSFRHDLLQFLFHYYHSRGQLTQVRARETREESDYLSHLRSITSVPMNVYWDSTVHEIDNAPNLTPIALTLHPN